MNRFGVAAATITALALGAWCQTATADSAAAMCEVRKDGETRKGASGPCDFSQRQGYVSIDLRNGETYELRPLEKANHFKDQKGRQVVRTASGDSHEYKWENRKIIVTFGSGDAHGSTAQGSGPQAFDTVCGVIASGETYRYRCRAEDHYSDGRKTRTVLRYPDMTVELTWHSADRVGLQFEGMVPKEARYSTYEGETNFVFEDKTYFYISNQDMARREVQNFRN